ncbi:hypothetical protein [Sphingosinicella sp.]|uniref:hypothetical protein n=1 Tax=Sphingosinicella sp. TaxID=1917971 RepID=UPI004037EC93
MVTGLGRALDLADWRANKLTQRAIMRDMVLESIAPGASSEAVIERCRRALNYSSLPERERRRIITMIHDVRTILGGWSRLSEAEQGQFREGRLVPSTAAARIRDRNL